MYFSQHIVIDDIVPNYIFFLFQERTNYLSITTLMFSNSQIALPPPPPPPTSSIISINVLDI